MACLVYALLQRATGSPLPKGERLVIEGRTTAPSPRRSSMPPAARTPCTGTSAAAGVCALTIVGMQSGGLLGGVVVVEVVYAWPGLGNL